VKHSRSQEVWTRSEDLQNWVTSCPPSLRIFVVMLILTVIGARAPQLGAESVTSGDIVGLVTDPSGAVLPNASVTLKSDEEGKTQAQSTNARGVYTGSPCCPQVVTQSRSLPPDSSQRT
jgi:hypothetical protein